MTMVDTGTRSGTDRSSRRTTLLIGLGILAALVVISVLTRDTASFAGPARPAEPRPRRRPGRGPRARGQRRRRPGRPWGGELLGEEVDAGTAVVVTNPGELGGSTLKRLLEHGKEAGAIVVVGDSAVVGGQFGIEDASLADGRHRANCDEPLARGLVVRTRDGGGLEAEGCFGSDGTSMLVRTRRGVADDGPDVVHQRARARQRQRRPGAAAAGAAGPPRLVRRRLGRHRGIRRSRALGPAAAVGAPGSLPASSRACSGSSSGADGGWDRWSPSRFPSSYARQSRPRAAAGSTAARATAGTPPRSSSTRLDEDSSRRCNCPAARLWRHWPQPRRPAPGATRVRCSACSATLPSPTTPSWSTSASN